MSIIRQANFLGQQRLDVPHLRALESSIAADFDLLAGRILAGDQPLVISGFDIITTGAIGSPASQLQLNVAGGVIMHPLASEHGTIFSVPADRAPEVLNSTNTSVTGSFMAGQTNYVGLDLRRTADDTTADLVMFLDANTLVETPKTVPLARTLQYKIVISTTDFSSTPHLLPLAKVTTDSTNKVTTLEDARPMAFRLGSGGSVPNRYNSFPWSAGRLENTSGAVFAGGDKAINSLKAWMDAVMTRLWELGGGQYWYSATSDRDVKVIYGNPVIPDTDDNFKWTLSTNTLEWRSIGITFANSPVSRNTVIDGSHTLLDGQCIYVDIDRTTEAALTVQKADLTTLGTPTIPGSRFVLAWRKGNEIFARDRYYEVGRTINVANTLVFGTVKLKYAAGDATDPRVLAQDANGAYVNTAGSGHSAAFIGTGHGTGPGLVGIGGGNSGTGVRGEGGGPNGAGVHGIGVGSGPGGLFSSSNGYSVDAISPIGARFLATGSGSACIYAEGMAPMAIGLLSQGYNGGGLIDNGVGARIFGGGYAGDQSIAPSKNGANALEATGGPGTGYSGSTPNINGGDGGGGIVSIGGPGGRSVQGQGGGGGNGVIGAGGTGGDGAAASHGGDGGVGGYFVGGAGGSGGAGQGQGGYGVYAQGGAGGHGLVAVGGTGNTDGVRGTGSGTSAGIRGFGGSSSGPGVRGSGGGPNGAGVHGIGVGSGPGGLFSSSNGYGIQAQGGAEGHGLVAVGGTGNTDGVRGTGSGTGAGIRGFGGGNSGTGVRGEGGGPNGTGVHGIGTGTGVGGYFSSSNGHGIQAQGGAGGHGLVAVGGTGNTDGVRGTGSGTGAGINGFGGGNSGTGVRGEGGGPNGTGVHGIGVGSGPGGLFSSSNGHGIQAQGGVGSSGIIAFGGQSAPGIQVIGGSGSYGILVYAGAGNTTAVHALGSGDGIGINGIGGGNSGTGVRGSGGGPNGIGVLGIGTGTGAGGRFSSSLTYGTAVEITKGVLKYTATGNDLNPPNNIGFTNTLTAKNIIKAWGLWRGKTSTDTFYLIDGFNMSSSYGDLGNNVRLLLENGVSTNSLVIFLANNPAIVGGGKMVTNNALDCSARWVVAPETVIDIDDEISSEYWYVIVLGVQS